MIEQGLMTYLSAQLPTTQFYASRLPQNAAFPNTVYHIVSTTPTHDLAGYSGLTESRIQFDCWGMSYADTATASENLRVNLDGYKGTMGTVTVSGSLRINQFAMPPESSGDQSDTYHYRTVAEYRIFYVETIPSF